MNHPSNTRRAPARAGVLLACTLMTGFADAQELPPPVEDSAIRGYFLIDQLEHTTTRTVLDGWRKFLSVGERSRQRARQQDTGTGWRTSGV